ncbi:MAG: hypothetical protein ACK5CC_07035 [Bacteroidota bacterium]|jgi:hypothetical protein
MKNQIKNLMQFSIALMASLFVLSSCQKEFTGSLPNATSDDATQKTPAFTAIPVSINGAGGSAADSVYVVYDCDIDLLREPIPIAALPQVIHDFQTDLYENLTPLMAFIVSDEAGNMNAYISILRYNNRPVALEFSVDGTFKKVLEQREKDDLDNDGWHPGGLFDERDGANRDNIDLALLPDEIKNYLSANYTEDSLLKAFKTKEDAYLVLSKNNGGYAHVFNSSLQEVKYMALCGGSCQLEDMEKTALSTTTLTKLSNTFPNYVFNKAEQMQVNGTSMGNLVLINANNTRYAVRFNSIGNMVDMKVIF